jgi:thioredoxin-dependent peroxiredoxin
MLAVGNKAPAFNLKDADGKSVKLSELKGKRVILYFYPKDLTPGCTVEACEFRDEMPRIKRRNAVVLGVSPDDEKTHRKFREKYELTFPLLADTDHKIAEAYGVWREKSMYGRKYWGVARTTFVIDETGRIAQIFEKVKPAGHGKEIAEAIKS